MRISGNSLKEKDFFYGGLFGEWTTHLTSELIIGMGDINGYVGGNIDGFKGVHGGYSIDE